MLNGAKQVMGWARARGRGPSGFSTRGGVRGSPAGPLPQPQMLFLFFWTRFPLAHEK